MEKKPLPAIEKVLKPNGDPIWVSGGANTQDGSKALHRCEECGGEVVWVKSTRTGRHYPADVSRGYNDQRYYVKANPHFTSCGKRVETNQLIDLSHRILEIADEYKRTLAFVQSLGDESEHLDLIDAVFAAWTADDKPLKREFTKLGGNLSTLR